MADNTCHNTSKDLVVPECQDADSSSHCIMLAFPGWQEEWAKFDSLRIKATSFLVPHSQFV